MTTKIYNYYRIYALYLGHYGISVSVTGRTMA